MGCARERALAKYMLKVSGLLHGSQSSQLLSVGTPRREPEQLVLQTGLDEGEKSDIVGQGKLREGLEVERVRPAN